MPALMRKLVIERVIKYSTIGTDEDSISAEAMIHHLCGSLPKWAVNLRGLRMREGLTQVAFGQLLNINQTNISKMELGKRSIGKTTAKRLAALFHADYRLFL